MKTSHAKRLLFGVAAAVTIVLSCVAMTPVMAVAQTPISTDPITKTAEGSSIGDAVAILDTQASTRATSSTSATFNTTVTGTVSYTKAWEVLSIANKERAAQGLSALTMDKDLLDAAMQRAAETSLLFDHTRPNGTTCFTASSKMYGENIAMNGSNASDVMDMWMNSEGHRANILGQGYASIGIGCYTEGGHYYWVQCFGFDDAAAAS